MILDEMAKFATEVLLPLNQSGDEEGAKYLDEGRVATPSGFQEAFRAYADAGWVGLGGDPEYGGQGMPKWLPCWLKRCYLPPTNHLPYIRFLTVGATLTYWLPQVASKNPNILKNVLRSMGGCTMCLTESHSGTDSGIIKTRATPNEDGSYRHYWYQNIHHRWRA